jgi:succinate dehydrogenase / fumarate reductase, iron-sulfur subunit
MRISIYRYSPETDEVPYMKDYQLELPEGSDLMVLDVLERLKEQDPALSYRRSCREGVCGSDGMNINGMNALACTTPVSTALQRPPTRRQAERDPGARFLPRPRQNDHLVLRPLPGLPVIRDLVVDLSQFWRQYEAVKPYLQNDRPPPAQERLQSPEERAQLDGYYECILCACCSSACPSWWWNPQSYIGPAGLLWAYRFLADSRDTATRERLSELDDPFSVFRCRAILNCTAVCPKGLNPRHAISRIQGLLTREGV